MQKERVKAGRMQLFGSLDYLFLIVIENVSVKSIKIGKIALNSFFFSINNAIPQFVAVEHNTSRREHEAGAARNVISCRLHVCSCEKC